jgi:hypothetical protein
MARGLNSTGMINFIRSMVSLKSFITAAILLPSGLFLISGTEQNTDHNLTHMTQNVSAGPGLTTRKNTAFKPGEVLTYRLHYGIIDAGVAMLEVKPGVKTVAGRKLYHVVGNGYTKGSFDWFYKVRDRYETYIDTAALVPWMFMRRVDEGGFKFSQDYIFNRYTNKVDCGNNEVFPIKDDTQDMISAFYAARNIDFSNAKVGQIFSVESFVDKEDWPMKVKYVGKETIKSDIGKIRCLKFRPIVQKGRVFKKEEDLTVWISDDPNHIPIRAEAKILFGAVRADITNIQNNLSPIAKE